MSTDSLNPRASARGAVNEELLDLSDIANLYRVSRRYARDVLVKSPGFPMPVLAISQKTRRWSVADVRRWLCERRAMGSR